MLFSLQCANLHVACTLLGDSKTRRLFVFQHFLILPKILDFVLLKCCAQNVRRKWFSWPTNEILKSAPVCTLQNELFFLLSVSENDLSAFSNEELKIANLLQLALSCNMVLQLGSWGAKKPFKIQQAPILLYLSRCFSWPTRGCSSSRSFPFSFSCCTASGVCFSCLDSFRDIPPGGKLRSRDWVFLI